ncbi:uncharacterized protein [Hyperolius riggenbachi]|uniref:uncharacterized protein n=1 Tax=Hyperolius riggenbachi TaxID=752182 RepID=UPI0035A37F83
MPNCIIEGCPNRKTKNVSKEGVILHSFPSSLEETQKWLESTGQDFSNLELLAGKIFEGNDNNIFRVCSEHFQPECYNPKTKRKMLLKGSVPTLFPKNKYNILITEEAILNFSRKKRKLSEVTAEPGETCLKCPTCKTVVNSKKIPTTSELSTQTEETEVHLVYPESMLISTPIKSNEPFIIGSQSLPSPVTVVPDITFDIEHMYNDEGRNSDVVSQGCIPNIGQEIEIVDNVVAERDDCEEPNMTTSTITEKNNKDEDFDPNSVTMTDSDCSHVFANEETLVHELMDDTPDNISKAVKMRKFIIFEQCLDELLLKISCQFFPDCTKKIKKVSKEVVGSAVIIRGVCEDGHRGKIVETQPKMKHHFAGNILIASTIVCAGLGYTQISHFFNILGIALFCEKTFHKYQKRFVYPAVDQAWKDEQNKTFQSLAGETISIAGDGQCDSPGHNAKYCVYTIMDLVSTKILDFEIVQSTQCKSSVAMEKHAFEVCMPRVVDRGVDIFVFASDRHVGIRKTMSTTYTDIVHQFDVWHYAKNISKKIRDASKNKSFKSLAPWVDKIRNHFWWAIKDCENNVDNLERNWLSVLHHVRNEHSWIEDGRTYSCCHDPITEKENEEGIWLNEKTPAYDLLSAIVNDPKLKADFEHLKWSCHTGPLEVYHSTVLKYRSKRMHYSMDGMECRTKLAALTNNCNVARPQAVVNKEIKNSRELGSKRYLFCAPKGKKTWVTKNIYERREFSFLEPILEDSLKLSVGTLGSDWSSRSSTLPKNIASVPRPDVEELLKKRHFRFGLSK